MTSPLVSRLTYLSYFLLSTSYCLLLTSYFLLPTIKFLSLGANFMR